VGQKWSRLSEELPLHRLVDLCILLVKVWMQHHSTRLISPIAMIEAGTFEGQKEPIELKLMDGSNHVLLERDEQLKSRLRKLRDELVAANLG
jgi:hypothetical protein